MNSFQEIFQQQQQHRGIISIFCVRFFSLIFYFFKKHILVNVVVVLQSVNSIALFSLHRKMHHSALAHLLPKCTEMKRHPNSL